MTLQVSIYYAVNVEIDVLLYCIGSVLPITRVYAYKYTHVISLHAVCLFFMFFVFTLKTILHAIGPNRLM